MRTNTENFVKIVQTRRHREANSWTKITNFDSFGGCILTFLPHIRESWCAKFHVYWGNASLLRGEKLIFGPLSLPVIASDTVTGKVHVEVSMYVCKQFV